MNFKKILLNTLQIFLLIITVIGLVSIIATWNKGVEPGALFCIVVSGGLYLFVRKCAVGDTFIPVFGKLVTLNRVFLIVGCIFFVIVGMTQFGDVGQNNSGGYVSDNSDTNINSSEDSNVNSNVSSNTDTNTDSGVEDGGVNQNGNVYSLSEIGNLNGFFSLNQVNQTLIGIPAPLGYCAQSSSYDNGVNELDGVEIGITNHMPITVDRTKGEKLVVVGEIGNRVGNTVTCGVASVVGYSNLGYTKGVQLNSIEVISGIDISNINDDMAKVNSAISNTSFSVVEYRAISATSNLFAEFETPFSGYLYLSNTYGKTFIYGAFEGTEYIESNVAMTDLTYLFDMEGQEAVSFSIEKTKDGYFIVDITQATEGYYIMRVRQGNGWEYYPIYIK